MASIAAFRTPAGLQSERRRYRSPAGPKMLPGVMKTFVALEDGIAQQLRFGRMVRCAAPDEHPCLTVRYRASELLE